MPKSSPRENGSFLQNISFQYRQMCSDHPEPQFAYQILLPAFAPRCCSKHKPRFLLQKQPRSSWICSSRKRLTDTAWASRQGGEHKEQPRTRTCRLSKIQGLFKEKILTIRMEEEFFFSFFFASILFLFTHFSQTWINFSVSLGMTKTVEQEGFGAASFSMFTSFQCLIPSYWHIVLHFQFFVV